MLVKDTTFKLHEAEYFLKQMKTHSIDFLPFTFNLSGFVSAARSVTFVMKVECSDHPKFSEWYSGKEQEMKKDEDFAFFNDQRRTTIHMHSIKPYFVIAMGPFTTNQTGVMDIPVGMVGHDGQILKSDDWITIDGVPHPEIEKPSQSTYFAFEDKSEISAIEVCERYLSKLQPLVTELESVVFKE